MVQLQCEVVVGEGMVQLQCQVVGEGTVQLQCEVVVGEGMVTTVDYVRSHIDA